jgi:hypothetical protein
MPQGIAVSLLEMAKTESSATAICKASAWKNTLEEMAEVANEKQQVAIKRLLTAVNGHLSWGRAVSLPLTYTYQFSFSRKGTAAPMINVTFTKAQALGIDIVIKDYLERWPSAQRNPALRNALKRIKAARKALELIPGEGQEQD